jgi:hemoglobin-like flavoprotein
MPRREALIEKFYAHLFALHPETQTIFTKVDKAGLRRKLLLALITIVDSLEDNEQLYISL